MVKKISNCASGLYWRIGIKNPEVKKHDLPKHLKNKPSNKQLKKRQRLKSIPKKRRCK